MNKLQAVTEIIKEARKDKRSVTGYKRMQRALKALEFNGEDAATVMVHLEYHHYHYNTREPYEWVAKALAAKSKPHK
jgi:hypothetical protein